MDIFKYQAAGDDFVILDNIDGRHSAFLRNTSDKKKMVNRNFGIGSNGILEIKSSSEADYEVVYHDAAGQKVGVCGNGCRMALAYAITHFLKHKQGQEVSFCADDGLHTGTYNIQTKMATVTMSDITQVTKVDQHIFINSGTPHLLCFVDDLERIDLLKDGERLSKDSQHLAKNQVFVNFIEERDDGLYPRCYDPSSGSGLQACGTASVAMAVASVFKQEPQNGKSYTVPINWSGGSLRVAFTYVNGKYTNITLNGPAKPVFEGKYFPDL